jgi:hypothetical protein
MAELSKQDLVDLAEAKLADAKLLLNAERSGNAYYLAGYAIELMLKAILSSRFRVDTLPDPEWSTKVFIHNFGKLADLALLKGELPESADSDPEFFARWQIALQWKETSRYDSRGTNAAQELIEAIEHPEHGVLQWLRARL